MPQQINHGIHFRQWARAFVIADAQKQSRVVFVNADICMGTQIMKIQVCRVYPCTPLRTWQCFASN